MDIDTEQCIQLQHHQCPHHEGVYDQSCVGNAVQYNDDYGDYERNCKYNEHYQ